MTRELTCIGCPMGCRISAEIQDGKIIKIEGNSCNVGKKYAEEELSCPKRMVTALVQVQGTREPLCVKTREPIEKRLIFDCLRELEKVSVVRPIHIGQIVLKNVCGTGVDVVATREYD